MCVWRLRLPARKEILVAIIHFFDRRNHSEYDQHSLSGELARFLRDAEMVAGHGRTVLVGDFNMNPFDKGMIDAKGFGAMMTRALTRNLKGDGQDPVLRFYNPMWGRFGDSTVGPPGTFYHRQNAPTNISWHMLDQVLIRPDLIRAFREDSLSILTRVPTGDGEIDLIRENRKHWSLAVSDHLPILFQMNLSEDLPHE
jgi:endonuclease/exonuclease/phosphatase family metal-dependent hydrolase